MPSPMSDVPRNRARGRPRKFAPWDRLREPPEWIKRLDLDNLQSDDARKASKEITEYHRRESVSDSVRAAYSEGRNTANRDRQTRKQRLLEEILASHRSLILSKKLSASAVAAILSKNGILDGLRVSTIRRYVAFIRESWQGQIDEQIS